jgi:DNA-binding transcriptional ArsR family regulator
MTNLGAKVDEMELDEVLKALSHPMRRQILVWLKTPEAYFEPQLLPFDNGVCAGRIFDRSGLSASTVSAHLACLQRAGLVSTTRIGQWVFYKRDEAAIDAFARRLAAVLQTSVSTPDEFST